MISETMPLNEWPLAHLHQLKQMLICSDDILNKIQLDIRENMLSATIEAIKDVEFELAKLPMKTTQD